MIAVYQSQKPGLAEVQQLTPFLFLLTLILKVGVGRVSENKIMGIKISNDRIERFLVGKKFLLYQRIGDYSRYACVFYEEGNNDDVIKSIYEVSIKDGLGYVEHFDSSKEGFSNKIFEIIAVR